MLWIACWYLVFSLITFVTYGWDKHRARVSKWRVREQTLHILELLGGWPGAIVAQRVFHHKSSKKSFLLVFWTIVAIHVAAWLAVVYRLFHA